MYEFKNFGCKASISKKKWHILGRNLKSHLEDNNHLRQNQGDKQDEAHSRHFYQITTVNTTLNCVDVS